QGLLPGAGAGRPPALPRQGQPPAARARARRRPRPRDSRAARREGGRPRDERRRRPRARLRAGRGSRRRGADGRRRRRAATLAHRAPVAQGIERCPAEAEVACSNHAGRISCRCAAPLPVGAGAIRAARKLPSVPLYVTEAQVAELLTPAEALAAVEGSFARSARGAVVNPARVRAELPDGVFAVMPCVDLELGYAGLKTFAWLPGGAPFLVVLFSLERAEVAAIVEANVLGERRTAAASALAARLLARPDAASVGVLGCGRQAAAHVAARRGRARRVAAGGGARARDRRERARRPGARQRRPRLGELRVHRLRRAGEA